MYIIPQKKMEKENKSFNIKNKKAIMLFEIAII